MNITNKGRAWEIRNSLWILWTFTYFLNFISFFWIGARGKNRNWTLLGCMYLVVGFVLGILSTEISVNIGSVLLIISMISWPVSIVHAFLIRKAYLVRRELIVETLSQSNEAFREKIRVQASSAIAGGGGLNSLKKSETLAAEEADEGISKIDVNTCSERELAMLPGMGVAKSKRCVEMRANMGGFATIEEFTEALDIQPHFAVQIEKMVIFSQTPRKRPGNVKSSRTVDI